MKESEELKALGNDAATLKEEFAELTGEELEQVNGGVSLPGMAGLSSELDGSFPLSNDPFPPLDSSEYVVDYDKDRDSEWGTSNPVDVGNYTVKI